MTFIEVLLLQYLYIENNQIVTAGDEEMLAHCKYVLVPYVTVPIEHSMKNVI